MTTHHFHLQANWPGGRNATGSIKSGNLQTTVSIPPEMDGPGIGKIQMKCYWVQQPLVISLL